MVTGWSGDWYAERDDSHLVVLSTFGACLVIGYSTPACGDNARAMSRENVEIVRRIYAVMEETGSFTASGLLHADIEWVNPSDALESGIRKGRDAFDAAWSSVRDSFETVVFEPRDFLDGGDHVVVITVMRARGQGSGADVEHPQGHVWTVNEGKAVQLRWFHQPHLALQAAGLSEQDAGADCF